MADRRKVAAAVARLREALHVARTVGGRAAQREVEAARAALRKARGR